MKYMIHDVNVLAPSLLPILRSAFQGELLAWLYLHPEQEYSLEELARRFGVSGPTAGREANRLAEAGLIRERRRGRLRLLRAEADGPLARPLTELLALTYGPLPVLREEFATLAGIHEAYIYGSWAARYQGERGPVPNDIDVLAIGSPNLDDLDEVAEKAERRLRREVNIRRVRPRVWRESDPADPFLTTVRSRPLVKIWP